MRAKTTVDNEAIKGLSLRVAQTTLFLINSPMSYEIHFYCYIC